MVCTNSVVPDASPMFQHCMTASVRVANDDNSYVTEVFCSINNEQVKPVTSSLSYSNEEWSCICQGVEIDHPLENPLARFDCELYVRRCPSTIAVPRN